MSSLCVLDYTGTSFCVSSGVKNSMKIVPYHYGVSGLRHSIILVYFLQRVTPVTKSPELLLL